MEKLNKSDDDLWDKNELLVQWSGVKMSAVNNKGDRIVWMMRLAGWMEEIGQG